MAVQQKNDPKADVQTERTAEPKAANTQKASATPEGVSEADLKWWNNSQNRNYMAGDGPHAGQTVFDGEHQSVSSMDHKLREASIAEQKQAQANAAQSSVGGNAVDRDAAPAD